MEIQNWKAQAQKELKGKPIENLIQEIENGVFVQPLLNEVQIFPGVSFRAQNTWNIQQSFNTNDPNVWNRLALESLQGGTSKLVLPSGWKEAELRMALENIWIAYIEFQLPSKNEVDYKNVLADLAAEQGKGEAPNCHSFIFSSESLHALAASHAEQMAYLILLGIEHVESTDHSLENELAQLLFEFHISSKLLIEIAKLRGFRKLWAHVLSNANLEHACSNHCYLTAVTDRTFQAEIDSDNNLIRGTIQACAAVLGGANAIEVSPMESFRKIDNSDHLRWARNIHHLLADESYLKEYSDFALGSYSIEDLTNQLVEEAWNIMKNFKESSHLLAHIKSLSESRLQQREKEVIVGQNKYVRS